MKEVKCPDCNKNNKTDTTNGRVVCRRCKQHIIIEDSNPICCIPKEIFE